MPRSPLSLVSLVALALNALPPRAHAGEPPSRSIGHYSRGALEGGVHLADDGPDHYLLMPARCYGERLRSERGGPDDNAWGHATTVSAIGEALAAARALHPDAPRIAVAEIGHEVGGPIDGHLSHQNGLDVDIPFWQRGATPERPLAPCTQYPELPRFERKDPESGRWLVPPELERAWNWTLAAAFAARRDVQAIFVGTLVKQALADWARDNKVPAAERRRTLAKLVPVFCRAPKGVELPFYRNNYCPHDDHFHVRMKCPQDSPRCVARRK